MTAAKGRERKKRVEEEHKARVAENVYRMRLGHGWSQATLADKAGLGQNSVSRLEAGESKPHQGTLERLAEAFKCEVGDLTQRG